MGWKSVAWAVCLVPVLAGCGARRHAPLVTDDARVSPTRVGFQRDQRRDAHNAWQAVRARHPERPFSGAFGDGFLDGYAEYLDRGDAAQPPAVPPTGYASDRNTPEGQAAVRDYSSGFHYGAEVAVASGRRATDSGHAAPLAPAVPFVPPAPKSDSLPPPRPVTSDTKPGGKKPEVEPRKPPEDDAPKSSVPPLPKPELPVIRPFNPVWPDEAGGLKFGPLPVPPDPDRLPVPNPPLPIPVAPLVPPAPGPSPTVPSILDAVPSIPFQFVGPSAPTDASTRQK